MDLKKGMGKWLLGNKQMTAQNRTTLVTFTSFVFLQLCVIKRPCVFFLRRGGYWCYRSGSTAKGVLANRSFSRRLSDSGLILIYIGFGFPSGGLQDSFFPSAWAAVAGRSPPRRTETWISTLFCWASSTAAVQSVNHVLHPELAFPAVIGLGNSSSRSYPNSWNRSKAFWYYVATGEVVEHRHISSMHLPGGFDEENLKDQESQLVSQKWGQWWPALFLQHLLRHLLLSQTYFGEKWWFKGRCDAKRGRREMSAKQQQLALVLQGLNFCMGDCCCAVALEELLSDH